MEVQPSSPSSPTKGAGPQVAAVFGPENSPAAQKVTLKTPPPGYKLVKVRKESGVIVTVMRKMTVEESETNGQSKSSVSSQLDGVNYKIVLVPQPDGTMKKFRRIIPAVDQSIASQPETVVTASLASDTGCKAPTKLATEPAVKNNDQVVGIEEISEAVPTTTEMDKPQTKSAAMDSVLLQHSLDAQKQKMRQQKMRGFKSKLTRGLSTVVGSAIPGFEISTEYHHGDQEVIDDDDDNDEWSCSDDDEKFDHNNGSSHIQRDYDAKSEKESYTNYVTVDGNTAVTGMLGTLISGAAQQPAPQGVAAKMNGAQNEKSQVAYTLTTKDIQELDQEAENLRLLKKHWANVTFYILASLSIILPLLFLILGIAIFLMNGREVGTNWGKFEQVIKVAVSAWPIIFAAVLAQVFKTFATYKVERGIKLMELEQLVGSTSFASAMKQPILLRRMDILSLILFVSWCISPLGSSALQRTYSTDTPLLNTTTTVYYLNTTGPNRAFGNTWGSFMKDDNTKRNWADAAQSISVLYTHIFAPSDLYSSYDEDNYNNPKPPGLDPYIAKVAPFSTSEYGVPTILNESIFTAADDGYDPNDGRWESTTFVMRSSFFQFNCGNWSVVNGSYLDIPLYWYPYNTTFQSESPCSIRAEYNPGVYYPDDSNYTDGSYYCLETGNTSFTTDWTKSSSGTSHIRFGYQNPDNSNPTVNSIAFASLNKAPSESGGLYISPLNESDSEYSLLNCTFDQVFIEFGVTCSLSAGSITSYADCWYDENFQPVRRVQESITDLGASLGFYLTSSFMQYTNPDDGGQQSTTFNEIFLGLYNQEDKFNANAFNLSSLVSPNTFGKRMSYLFTTFVNLGNMFDISSGESFMTYANATWAASDPYKNFNPVHNAWWCRTGPVVFVVNIAWAIVFLVCVILLLAAGIISVVIESLTVAPDTLGYVSSVARNSKHLRLPKSKVNSAMSGGERANKLGRTVVMMQDVQPTADVGRIALGLKHEKAKKLEAGRLYR